VPELPDITVYLDALEARILHHQLHTVRILNPFVLRTVDPPLSAIEGKFVTSVGRIGKRITIGMSDTSMVQVAAAEEPIFIVIHLMIAGRLRWVAANASAPKKIALAAFDFDNGTLILTEAGTTRRASISLVRGMQALHEIDRGGINVLASDLATFTQQLRKENHTLKRSLTDPRLFDGIGNAYSDEILHRAKLSPVALSKSLPDTDVQTLYNASRAILTEWIARLREQTGDKFPERVTAFHDEMAVHGKYGKPCPVCQSPVQRIRYATNETNYCARCQTGGRLLADRALSRLLKKDWPKSIDEL